MSYSEREFQDSLLMQSDTERVSGRAAILGFPSDPFDDHFESTIRVHDEFSTMFVDDIRQIGRFERPQRTLIILEDLGHDWIEVLTAELGVPIDVFAQHWARPAHHNDGKVRVPLGQDVHRHYVLNYDQLHAITIPGVDKGWF